MVAHTMIRKVREYSKVAVVSLDRNVLDVLGISIGDTVKITVEKVSADESEDHRE